jgi:uncharacterized protein YcbK (DUF882 family)
VSARPRLGAISMILALAACAGAPPPLPSPGPPGPGGERSITLQHPWTGETARVTYRRVEGYDAQALAALAQVMRDRRTGAAGPLDPALVDMIWEIRAMLRLPEDATIHVISGFRSPSTNASLARADGQVAENSLHVQGRAADIRIPGRSGAEVAAAAKALGRGGGAHYGRTGHVHVDTGAVRTWKAE